mgnify:CR=1 FL=1
MGVKSGVTMARASLRPLQGGLSLGFNIQFDVADVNNDGAKDIAVGKSGSAQVYFFNTTTSTWQSISTGLPTRGVQGVKLADMDMDGSNEVVVWSSKNISIYKSDPAFQWSQIASFTISETAVSGIAVADFDHVALTTSPISPARGAATISCGCIYTCPTTLSSISSPSFQKAASILLAAPCSL